MAVVINGTTGIGKVQDGSIVSADLDTNITVSGDLTVDTSTLKVDSTNNKVGTIVVITPIAPQEPNKTVSLIYIIIKDFIIKIFFLEANRPFELSLTTH